MLHNPTVHVPPWPLFEPYSPSDSDEPELADPPVDVYSCDEFRMYEFKIRRCARGRSHDWTECPYAHPGEKARRRDPRKFHYAGTPCPDFRKGNCKKGDACEFAHGVFECWLHPARYRTQPCKDGTACRRRVCFFAHTPDQLRVLSPKVPESYDGSPMRYSLISSPRSTLISPPMSPPSDYSPPLSPSGLAIWLRRMQLGNANSAPWQRGASGFSSLPLTPKRKLVVGSGVGWMEDPTTERTELCKSSSNGNSSEGVDAGGEMAVPDVGWVSELVK